MKPKNIVAIVVLLGVFFFGIFPYVQHVVQKQSLDTDFGSIMLDYNTLGKEKFQERVREICEKAGLGPDDYELFIEDDPVSKRVTVDLEYNAKFKFFFWERTERVVLRNTTTNLGL